MRLLKINARLPQPKISMSLTDPLNANGRVSKMVRDVDSRYTTMKKHVKELFQTIPVSAGNAEAGNYYYDFSAYRSANFLDELQSILDGMLLEGDDFNHGRLWASTYVSDAMYAGTQKANSELGSLSNAYKDSRPLAEILYSQPYLDRLQLAYTRTYNDWGGLSDYTRQQVAEVITAGIANGDAPGVVEQKIVDRMDVSRSYARSIAQTEITNTLREANRREVKEAQVTLGMDTIMLWQSALMKTTRVNHAARHGKYYTPEEIDEFYSEGANRRNCHCSQTPALVMDGKPVILERTQEKLDKQREAWHGAHKKAA